MVLSTYLLRITWMDKIANIEILRVVHINKEKEIHKTFKKKKLNTLHKLYMAKYQLLQIIMG